MSNSSSSAGPGCLTLLGILFVALKLLGKITWSWWLVLSPFIIEAVVVLVIILVAILVALWVEKNE